MPNDEIVKLKAEIFDLQIQYGQIKLLVEEKYKKLAELIKKQNENTKP